MRVAPIVFAFIGLLLIGAFVYFATGVLSVLLGRVIH